MTRRQLFIYSYIASGIIILGVLMALAVSAPPSMVPWLAWVLFCGLIVFTDAFGVRLPAGVVSLLPMTTAAAYLVMGLVPAGWVAFVGTVIYGWVRALWHETLHLPAVPDRLYYLSLMAINATMHTGSILVGGVAYQALGGTLPLAHIRFDDLLPLLGLGLAYLAFNHVVAAIVIAARSRDELKGYARSLPHLLFYEGAPLIFAQLVALIYTQLGTLQFLLFTLLLIIASLITRSLALTSGRLERRIQELDSLQAVGQVISASLDVDTILAEIYTQVAALMPARNFYVALYDAEADEVSFPLAFEQGVQVTWRSRQTSSGLTEYLLETGEPLLMRKDVAVTLKKIGIDQIGTPAASWLGVPMLVEQQAIGVIAIQSLSTPNAYDISHREVLTTIAAQAAVAIQNARLYARTDEALARRVQELDSILQTTGEGILLLDDDYRVVAANRALGAFLGVAQAEITQRKVNAIDLAGERSLLALMGFRTFPALAVACREVSQDDGHHKQIVKMSGTPERHLERTLAPVRDRQGDSAGWLLVFRDISEEIELAQLREDMMHMLVHDLRSPLNVFQGSLEMMEMAIEEEKYDHLLTLEQMARRGSDQMLRLVNELLDISKLESGELPINVEPVPVDFLFRESATRLTPLAEAAHITFDLRMAKGLPALHVDVTLMERVVHNLVDNAIKFTPDHGAVTLWAKADPGDDGALLLGITDTGPGIPPDEVPRLFEKFQQTSATGRRVGTGLGLPFCKLAVEAHGGEIWIESEVGQGSTFVMRLPTVTRL